MNKFIPPYENSEWPRWESILNRKVADAADFDEMMETLHGPAYKPQMFSNFLFNYFRDEGGEESVLINPRPNSKKISKRHLFDVIIPFIQNIARRCPEIFYSYITSSRGINNKNISTNVQTNVIESLINMGAIYPLNLSGGDKNIIIPRPFIVPLLACAFFGIFNLYEYKEFSPDAKRLAYKNFSSASIMDFVLGGNNIIAFECIIGYFDRVRAKVPAGNLIISRTRTIDSRTCDNEVWTKNTSLSHVRLYTNLLSEHSPAHAQIISTSGRLGSMISNAKNATDIMFPTSEHVNYLIHPELFILPLFVENMAEDESIAVLGAEIYSSVIYSEISPGNHELKYSGEYFDNVHRVRNGTPARTLIFINAGDENKTPVGLSEDFIEKFKNVVNTLYTTINSTLPKTNNSGAVFSSPHILDISIGPWDSVHDNSMYQLRFIQLLIASSLAQNNRINYHKNNMLESSRSHSRIISKIESFMKFLGSSGTNTAALISAYKKFMQDLIRDRDNNYGEYKLGDIDVFDEIKKRLND